MSLLSRIISFFTHNSTKNVEQIPQLRTLYNFEETSSTDSENSGTYDMYPEISDNQNVSILGTSIGTEEISNVLEAQSRRYEHELII